MDVSKTSQERLVFICTALHKEPCVSKKPVWGLGEVPKS